MGGISNNVVEKISPYVDVKDAFEMALCSKAINEKWNCALYEKYDKWVTQTFTEKLGMRLPITETLRRYNFVFEFSTIGEKKCELKFVFIPQFPDPFEVDPIEANYVFDISGIFEKETDSKGDIQELPVRVKRSNALNNDAPEEEMCRFDKRLELIPARSQMKFYFFPEKKQIQILAKDPAQNEFFLYRNYYFLDDLPVQFCVTDTAHKAEAKICKHEPFNFKD